MAKTASEVVEAVNFNDAAQTVIAGSKAAVDKACEILKAHGAKRALLLPVSAPFHSSLMRPAAEKLKARLEDIEIAAPQIALVNNIDVAVEVDADRIRDALYRQAFGPGALGGVCASHQGARPDHLGRVRSWQGAGRYGQAHRRRDDRRSPV